MMMMIDFICDVYLIILSDGVNHIHMMLVKSIVLPVTFLIMMAMIIMIIILFVFNKIFTYLSIYLSLSLSILLYLDLAIVTIHRCQAISKIV
jgi:hypothetical protein